MKNLITTSKKNAMKFSAIMMAFLLLATLPMVASAHALKETSARITLRDGQVEIKLTTDINRWQTLLQDNQAWLLGDINQVMPTGLTPKQNKVFLNTLLKNHTSIRINKKPLALDMVSINTLSKNHGHFAEIVLTGKHSFPIVETVNVQFPKSLGAVLASFVKPQYKMMTPGGDAEVSFASPGANTTVNIKKVDHHH